MSRGFISVLIGTAITIAGWFPHGTWAAWPALAVLSIAHRPETYSGRAAFVVMLIALNIAVWAGIAYAVLRGVTMKKRVAAFFVAAILSVPLHAATLEKAIFSGGCFWCTESDFEKVRGVVSAVSGYTGGRAKNPGYEAVSAGGTGHRESGGVKCDREKTSYAKLVDVD